MIRPLRRLLLPALLVALAAGNAAAQAETDETLRRAIRQYEDLEVERALAMLREVISPSSPFEVSRAQRVLAYKYLGAALTILGQRDSGVVYFRAALERDPFLDLEVDRFTQQEQAAFAEAKQRSFVVGVRGPSAGELDPKTSAMRFVVVTTQPASLRAEVRSRDGVTAATLLSRESDGVREVQWNGSLPDGRLAPPGRYQIHVYGRVRATGQEDSTVAQFILAHEHGPLEDTLPELRPDELRPERHPPSAGPRALLKGIAIGVAALALPSILGHSELNDGRRTMAMSAAGAAVGIGAVALAARQRRPEIPANVAHNTRLRTERAKANAAIAARNAERLAAATLIITPIPGSEP